MFILAMNGTYYLLGGDIHRAGLCSFWARRLLLLFTLDWKEREIGEITRISRSGGVRGVELVGRSRPAGELAGSAGGGTTKARGVTRFAAW